MKNGIYQADFTSGRGLLGTGAMLVRNGSVYGADPLQFYRGEIDQNDKELSVIMELTRHTLVEESVLGSSVMVTLLWRGEAIGDTAFKLSCLPENSTVPLYVSGRLLLAHD